MTRAPRSTWLWAAVPIAVFVALWSWTLRRWTDVTVDFGRELYVAWRLAEGDVLHRDLAWFSGPLSALANGALFRTFGTSLSTLIAVNTALAAALFTAVFVLVRRHTSAAVAGIVTSVALAVFGFGQHGGIGNYDYVTPYSHEPVHGLVLGMAAVAAAWRGRSFVAGALLGLVFLTKVEPFVAAALGCAAALVAAPTSAVPEGARRRSVARDVLMRGVAVALGFVCVVGLVSVWFAQSLGALGAARAVAGAWWHVVGGEVTGARFYERLAGLDDPAHSLGVQARWSAAWLGALALVVFAARAAPARIRTRGAFAFALGGVACVGASLALGRDDVYDVGAPVTAAVGVVLIGLAAQLAAALRRGAISDQDRAGLRSAAVWAVFALASLLKLGLRPTFVFYGFVHALPAFVVVAAAVAHGVPRMAARMVGAPERAVAAGVAGLLLALAGQSIGSTAFWRRFKVNEVGAGGDRILADGRGDEVREALGWIGGHTEPTDTVLVLPEGLSLNYWARRRTPTRFLGFMPTELELFGEADIVAALDASPPTVVVLVHKDTTEYGARFLGADYGRALAAWVAERYEPAASFGAPPFVDHRFGVAVLRRRER